MPQHHNFDVIATNKKGNKIVRCFKSNALVIATLSGVVLGAALGAVLRQTREWTIREQEYVGYLGEVFLQMLKSLIVPLIVSSLVSAIASLDLSLSGKIALKAMTYYLTTTFVAVVLGIIVVVSINPGEGHSNDLGSGSSVVTRNATTVDTLLDLGKNMFPPNIIEACLFQYRTNIVDGKTEREVVQTTNILGLVVVSVAIGIALAQLREEAIAMTSFFRCLMTVMLKITTWVIWLSPIGVMCLVAYEVLQMKDIASVMASLGKYFATVCVGLFLQGFLVLPTLYYVLTRKNPFKFLVGISQALATAFGTASSSATLPVTIRCLEENLGIDTRVARFCIPIGASINLDGTALYEAVAAIYIAQLRGISLGIGTLIAISITATAASIGAAGIPQAGMVTLVLVLDTVGLDSSDVSLILAVDWLLDRFRTTINVMGDSFGAAIVHHRSKKELKGLESETLSVHSDKSADIESVNNINIERKSH